MVYLAPCFLITRSKHTFYTYLKPVLLIRWNEKPGLLTRMNTSVAQCGWLAAMFMFISPPADIEHLCLFPFLSCSTMPSSAAKAPAPFCLVQNVCNSNLCCGWHLALASRPFTARRMAGRNVKDWNTEFLKATMQLWNVRSDNVPLN